MTAPSSRPAPTRRDILRWLAVGSVAGPAALAACSSPTAPRARDLDLGAAADPSDRVLVVIELVGGNDGLGTLVPHGTGRYHDLRPTLAVAPEDVIDLDGTLGLHRSLAPLADRPLAVVAGIGTAHPDLSHFEMERRWWECDPGGDEPRPTGFLGRLCDALHADEPLTGASLGWGPSPALTSEAATTIGLPDPDSLWMLAEGDDRARALREAMATMAGGRDVGDGTDVARAGVRAVLDVADLISSLPEPAGGYPETDLGWQLTLAGRMLAADAGIRVLHIPADGGYDTHTDHAEVHPRLLSELAEAVAAFQSDLEARGLGDRTLICTTSEFGRRVEENEGGLDHGTASVSLLAGPFADPNPGGATVVGDHPDLGGLDDDGNLVATVGFDSLYATLADWFEVDPSEVVMTGAEPLDRLW